MVKLVDVIALSKKECIASIECELVYATPYNFVGRILDGYHSNAVDFVLMTPKAAQALCQVQNELIEKEGLGLFVYDAYRPARTVRDFAKWASAPVSNEFELERKALHYPHIEKSQMFDLGYLSHDSNHCYGNTVDLVLMDFNTKKILNMGAIFDFMDPISHLTATAEEIGQEAYQNRQILTNVMEKFGFQSYISEFWHFCHGGRAGAEVKTPLDIEITADLKGVGA